LSLHGQSTPIVTTQPASQTVLPGSNATFGVVVNGIGPLSYQWQFNGSNLPNTNFTIATVAGNGSTAYGGDGGPATNTGISSPSGVALDALGNLYIADYRHYRVRRMDTNGIITSVAGNGSPTYSGDGAAATNAGLFSPEGVALDAVGNLYIADVVNNRIRKVDTNGIITTMAGNGNGRYSGDGAAATNASLANPNGVAVDVSGNLYIADTANARIRKVDTNGIITTVAGNGSLVFSGDGAAATSASLDGPEGAVLDAAGNLYIADTLHNRVRKVDTNGTITTVAGNGNTTFSGDGGAATNAGVSHPYGVGVDGFGNVYIVDYGHARIRRMGTNGIIMTVAGGGSGGDGGAATNASLNLPQGLGLDAVGNLYIADTADARIRAVHFAGFPTLELTNVTPANAGDYTVLVGSAWGSVTSAVATLTVEAPPVITLQPTNQAVLVGSNPTFLVSAAGSGPFEYLWYLAGTNLVQSDTNSTLSFVSVLTNDAGNYTAVITNAYGSVTSQVATLTVLSPPSVVTSPGDQTVFAGTNVTFSVTVAGTGPFIYQWQFNGTDLPNTNFIITTVAGNGSTNFSGDGGAATNAGLSGPWEVALDAAGNLFIPVPGHRRVRRVGTNGIITTIAGGGTSNLSDGLAATNASLALPFGAAVDGSGNLYFSDSMNCRVRKVDTNGIITTVAGNGEFAFTGDGGKATNASLGYPEDLAVDGSGNLYIADNSNERVRKVDTNGIITTVAGNGTTLYVGDGFLATMSGLSAPEGVAVDAAGNLYIADAGHQRILKVDTNGIITTVAGKGTSGYSGDGGPALAAQLANASGVALDGLGNIFIADVNNNRVRKVDVNGIITTVAGNGCGSYSGDGAAATNAGLNPFGVAVDGSGNLYLADPVNNRIRKAQLAGFPALVLSNVGAGNAGSYTVAITGPYGSVTSTVATLTISVPRTPPQVMTCDESFGFLTNRFGFNLGGAVGQTIVVDASSNLVDWIPLVTNTLNSTQFYCCDPSWTNSPWRFYRGRLP
jgi:sugar lactone lactonase YvrE